MAGSSTARLGAAAPAGIYSMGASKRWFCGGRCGDVVAVLSCPHQQCGFLALGIGNGAACKSGRMGLMLCMTHMLLPDLIAPTPRRQASALRVAHPSHM